MIQKEGGEKMICQGCGQEFTPLPRNESKTLCPKCFIQKLDGLVANNPGNPGIDPAQNRTMTDPKQDPQQPEPITPGAPVEPTGEEPAETPPPGAPTPAPGAPAPEGEEKKGEGEGAPPVPPVA